MSPFMLYYPILIWSANDPYSVLRKSLATQKCLKPFDVCESLCIEHSEFSFKIVFGSLLKE